MSAFRRRTSFAAPLIVSVAACSNSGTGGTGSGKQPQGYRIPVWSVTMQPEACRAQQEMLDCPPGVMCNPPPPQDVKCPPGSSGRNMVRIAQRADQSCAVMPPGCRDESCLTTPTDCPLPFGAKLPVQLGAIMEIELRKGSCHVEEKNDDCPPNVDCNPPAPRKVACPAGITEDKNVHIALLPDATCAVVPDGCTIVDCVGARTDCPK